MKILITESQYDRLILENPYIGIKSKNGLVSVKNFDIMRYGNVLPLKNLILSPSSNYRGELWLDILTKRNSLLIIESVAFNDETKGGTVGRFPQKPIESGSLGYIDFNLKPNNPEKGMSFVQLTLTVNMRVANSNVRDVLEIPIRYNVHSMESTLKLCKSKYNYQELKKAIDWYKNWLSNPITKSKFGKNFKYDNKKVEEIFKTYFYILNNIKTEYVFSDKPNGAWVQPYKNRFSKKEVGTVPITINCSVNQDDVVEVYIHEIQHLLDSYHKLHPYEENVESIFNSLFKNESGQSGEKNFNNLRNLIEKEGFDALGSSIIAQSYEMKLENDELHLKDPNEIMSAFYELRKDLNLKPGQQITKKMLIDNVNSDKVTHFLSQWIYSKMTLNNWLNYYNSVALNKNLQNNSLA